MPRMPEPAFNLQENFKNILKLWKKDPSFDGVEYQYSTQKPVWAEIRRNNGDNYGIPLPYNPRPYLDWHDYFENYLAQQLRIVAESLNIKAFYLTDRGRRIPIEPSE